MIHAPGFKFYISTKETPISPGSPLWDLPLSGKMSGEIFEQEQKDFFKGPAPSDTTVGAYFQAAFSFLSQSDCHLVDAALSAIGETEPSIKSIRLFLVKHGAFYHPIKVVVYLKNQRCFSFVLNGAVSAKGRRLMEREVELLDMFGEKMPGKHTPKVYGSGNVKGPAGPVCFFLGQWLDDYHEFHVSETNGQRRIVVWQDDGDSLYLPLQKAVPIYENIARILTLYYNLDSFEQVHPWHHAAGDFIVDPKSVGFPVKLISVRGYGSLVDFPSEDPKRYALPSLLFFFLNLSLRMQLDRLDGVGEMVFLGQAVLRASVKGFLKGVAEKSGGNAGGQPDMVSVFVEFINGFSLEQVMGVMEGMVESRFMTSSETRLIESHLETHCEQICSIFKNM